MLYCEGEIMDALSGKKDLDVRTLTVQMLKDGTMNVFCKELFTAAEKNKLMKTINQWYRVSRREFRVNQNRLRKD